jgi:hypothetical protein
MVEGQQSNQLYQSDLIFSPKLIKKDIIKCASIFSFIINSVLNVKKKEGKFFPQSYL